jgi:hypothetical protein
MRRHLGGCSSCRQRHSDHKAISNLFNRRIEAELLQASLEDIEENVVALIRKHRLPRWKRMANFLVAQRCYVPAGVVATALLLFFVLSGPHGSVSGPSALISYVGGDLESVVILETEKSHRTVVWFNEMARSDEEQRGVHEEQSTARTPSGRTYLNT